MDHSSTELLSKSVEELQRAKIDIARSVDLEMLKFNCSQGHGPSQFTLGQYYLHHEDIENAVLLFEQAAANGYTQAIYQLAVMMYDGIGLQVDTEKGFALMLQVAESKDVLDRNIVPSAQFNIGRAYFQGFGTKQNDKEAVKWWILCADSKPEGNSASVRAMNTLALFYSRPENTDKKMTLFWHEKAANFDHVDSMATLGLMYLKGDGCTANKETALRYLKKSTDKGSIYGTGLLTHYYYSTKLYTKATETAQRLCDLTDSVEELRSKSKSHLFLIQRGLATAFYIYAHCLRFGTGIDQNDPEAAKWYEKAKSADPNTVFELHKLMMVGRL